MEKEPNYQEVLESLLLDKECNPALHMSWNELNTHMSNILSAILEHNIHTKIRRENFYGWRVYICTTSLSILEINSLLSATNTEPEYFENYDTEVFPITEIYHNLSSKLLLKTFPFDVIQSVADDNGVWFVGEKYGQKAAVM